MGPSGWIRDNSKVPVACLVGSLRVMEIRVGEEMFFERPPRLFV